MNRIFKVIWSRTKGCYVVVAETAKNMSKQSTMTSVFVKMLGISICTVMLAGGIIPTEAQASSLPWGDNAQAKNGTVAIGDNSTAMADNSVALGTGATVTETNRAGVSNVQGVAIGKDATVGVNNGVAIGNSTKVASLNGFALGNRSWAGYDEAGNYVGADNDQAFGTNARAWGGSSMAFGNDAKASKGGAVAIGNGSQSRGEWGVAIGNGAKALAAGARAIGANSTADATNAAAMGWDSVASGEASIAIGETAKATKNNSIAMSKAAIAAADDSIAIGKNALVDTNQQRSIALGANSKTANVVSTPNQFVNGLWYKNLAGGSADSTLSVGSDTVKRTITNVAAGRMNASSTDAINGSQLYAVANSLGNLATTTKNILGGNAALDPDTGKLTMSDIGFTGKSTIHDAIRYNKDNIDKGLFFYGDNFVQNQVKLGDTIRIKGGATGALADNNIGVQADGNGTLNVKLAKKLTGLDSVTAGTATIDNKGVSVGGKLYVSTGGLNANNQQLRGVADGTGSQDAVNYGQLQRAINGTAKEAIVKANDDGNITIRENSTAKGGKEYTVGLNYKITVGKGAASHPVTIDSGTGTVTGLTNTSWNVNNPAPVTGRAATEDQLKRVNERVNSNQYFINQNTQNISDNSSRIGANARNITKIQGDITTNKNDINTINNTLEKGLYFSSDTGASIKRKLGDTLVIKGGATGALSDNNIGVVSDGTGRLTVKLAKYLTGLESVNAGNTTISKNGLSVGARTYVTPDGINANNQKITGVANGTAPNDAVNFSQLQSAIGGTAKATTVKSKDANVTVTEGTNAAGGKEYIVGLGNTINVGTAHPVTVDGNAGHVTGLQNTDWSVDNPVAVPGRAATEDQLKKVNDTVNANKDQIDKNKQAIADNKQNITTNAGNIANNTQNIAKNAGDIVTINKTIEKGLNFDGDSGATINKKLGDTVAVKGGATGTLSDNNIGVVSDGTGTLNVKLAKTLTGLDSVTAGDTTINNGGLTVGGKNYVSPNGINANDQKVTNVANGDVAPNSKDAVNGGQLHAAKNELNTKIDNTKTDLINKGLRFNADNDDEKTNKIGSKVTVNGDDNITTEITQTGDDTKIALKLKKDLTVTSVIATDTVKAGDVTMGKQADGANPGNTGNYITGLDNKNWDPGNVVSGRAATEDQLKQALANQTATGLKFDANVGGVQTSKLGSTVIVQGEGKAADADYSGENIKTFIKQDAATGNTTIDVKMSKNLKAESVKVGKGDNKDGVSITGPDGANGTDGKVGITGKDGKDAVSMSGKDGIGHIGLNGKDGRSADITAEKGDPDIEGNAITRIKYQDENGKTHQVATKDDGMKYGGDSGAVINKKLNEQVNVIGGITDAGKLTTEDNLGVVSDGSNNLKVRMAKDLKGLETVTTKDAAGNTTVVNGGGMKITPASGNPVSLTKDGLDNGGNKITNVAAGTAPTDAVNKSQLDQATAAATTTVTAGDNIKVTPSDNANGSKNYEVSLKDQVTLGSNPKKQIAIDGTAGTIKAGDKVEIDGNKGNIKAGNVTIDGENGMIKAGDNVTIDGKDGKIAAGKVSVDGKDGYVTGLENKDWDPANITSGRAATEDQLQKSHNALDNKITNLGDEIKKKGMNFVGNTGDFHRDLGQTVTIKGEGTKADDQYSGDNIKTIADQDGNITIKMAKNLKSDSLTTDKVKVGKDGQDGVSITGPDAANGTDGKVGIAGKDGKDAVSMSGKDGIGHIGLNGKDGRSADISVEKGDPDLDGNEITRIKYQDENGKTHQVATKDDGMKYGGDSGAVINKKLNEQVNVIGGITDASKLTTEDNVGVVSDGTGNLKVRMAKDLKGLETVTTKDAAGNTTVMNGGGVTITPASGNAVSLTKDGLNNGGNTITNVAAGVNGTDAVNVNQLKGATDKMANAINAVAGETQRVGAHAAAMSALKPIQYDPLEPTQVMAGIGNYRGETAAALGVAHYTAEDTMFHVGVSVGSHHNMVNAGVTHKFGNSDAKKAIPERYKGGPISSVYVLQDEVTALKAENARMQESLNELSSVKEDNEQMKAQIALLMQQAGLTK